MMDVVLDIAVMVSVAVLMILNSFWGILCGEHSVGYYHCGHDVGRNL